MLLCASMRAVRRIFPAFGRVFIRKLTHRGGRGYWINRYDLVGRMGYVRRGSIAVDRNRRFVCHCWFPFVCEIGATIADMGSQIQV